MIAGNLNHVDSSVQAKQREEDSSNDRCGPCLVSKQGDGNHQQRGYDDREVSGGVVVVLHHEGDERREPYGGQGVQGVAP